MEKNVQESEAREMVNLEQQERAIEVAFLSLVNESKRTAELIHSAVSFFRERFGLEAVGVRLQDGNTYPYFETSGFPEEFVRIENSLYARNEVGQPICDNAGNPIQECMCGSVICGRSDPSKPFFTARGSFWTNSTTELLAVTTDADRQARMRNRCNGEGYESVALIALSVSEECMGLLQLNDTRKGQFSLEAITLWERLAGYLAVALAKARVEEFLLEAYETLLIQSEKLEVQSEELQKANEALHESETHFRALAENSPDIIIRFDRQYRHLYANPAAVESYDIPLDEIIGKTQGELGRTPKNVKSWEEHLENIFVTGKTETLEYQYLSSQGKKYYFNTKIVPEFADGKVISVLATSRDITDIREAEAKLKETLDNLENLVEERTAELETAFNSLKESEKGLAEAQKMSQIGSWDWYLVTDEMYWSDEMYRIFGRTPQKFSSYSEVLTCTHPNDREHVDYAVKRALKGESFAIDHRIVLASGEERTVHAQGRVIFDENNNPIRIKGTVQDITERIKSEEKIRNLANIVESSNDAIGTISLDGIITSWNKGAEQVYGYSQEEILGKPSPIMAPPHLGNETKKLIERIKQGESIRHYETLRLRKDGKIINVSRTLSPVFDSHGKITAISFISRDITERKTIEEKLRESEEKYRNIVETANEGILIIDNEALITYANKKLAAMTGHTLEEIIGRPIWNFLSEESKAIVKLNLKNRRLGIDDSYELKLARKDGSLLWTFINAKSLFDKDDKFVGSMSMLTDITKRKEVEQALANFEIAREKEIHHRIKNNLQVVSSLLDLQAYKFKGRNDVKDSEIIEAFRESQSRIKSMALIHEELYRGGGSGTINFTAYVDELADNLLSTYRLGNIDIILNKNMGKDFFFDMETAIPLGIIINEIISNSFKHAFRGRDKGEIRIILHSEEKGDFVNIREESECEDCKSTNFVLSVSDNGVGIPENLDIADLDSLGLQLVTSLVEQIGGELEIKRNNGTEFTIRFIVTEKNNKASEPVPNNYSESPKFHH